MKRIALNISIVIASVCIAVFFANAAISATYYVSPSGSDSNAGSLSAPFKTLANAAGLVNAGDTVIAADGIYYENDLGQGQEGLYVRRGGTSGSKVMFRAMNPGKAIIDGNNTVQVGVYVPSNYVQIEGFQVRNFAREGVSVHGQYAIIKGNTVYNNGNGGDPTSSIGQNGIYVDSSAGNCMVDSNTVYANGRLSLGRSNPNGSIDQGIYLCGVNPIVQNNLIYGNQAFGIQIAGYVNMGSVLITNNTIAAQKNYSGIVIWLAGAKGCVIQNNIIVNNSDCGLTFLNDGGGHIVRNNDFFNNVNGAINPSKSSQYTASANLMLNPMLNSSYCPLSTSPVLKAGYTGLSPNYDITGAVRPSSSDVIGCFQ